MPKHKWGRTTARNAAGVGARRKGVCPVCRGRHALRDGDGKLMVHGKTAATPRGCAGHGEAPLRDATGTLASGVEQLRETVPHDDPAALPALDIDVLAERRDGPPKVHVRSALQPGPGAA